VPGRRRLVISLLSLPAAAQPKSDLWPRWLAHDETSRLSIDHAPWQALLSRRVDNVQNLSHFREWWLLLE